MSPRQVPHRIFRHTKRPTLGRASGRVLVPLLFLLAAVLTAACYERVSEIQGATGATPGASEGASMGSDVPGTGGASQDESDGLSPAPTPQLPTTPPATAAPGSADPTPAPAAPTPAANPAALVAPATQVPTTQVPTTQVPAVAAAPPSIPAQPGPAADDSTWTDPDLEPRRLVAVLEALHESRVVQNGDSILGIAAESGCRVMDFIEANPGLNPSSLLQPGARLNLPPCARRVLEGAPPQGGTYEVQSGDHLALIASAAGCSPSEILRANDLREDSVRTGDRLQIPDCSQPNGRPQVITEQAGIEEVARVNGCTVGEIVEASRLPSSDVIEVGTVVYVPDDCAGEPPPARPTGHVPVTEDHNTLATLMEASGFSAPRRFKAIVVELQLDGPDGAVLSERRLDWRGTGDDFDDWNPASSVKLFSAIGAAWRVQQLGFSSRASVVFQGETEHTTTVDELIGLALIPSDNVAHNRLVQIAGFDPLHSELFVRSQRVLTHCPHPPIRSRHLDGPGREFLPPFRTIDPHFGGRPEQHPSRSSRSSGCGVHPRSLYFAGRSRRSDETADARGPTPCGRRVRYRRRRPTGHSRALRADRRRGNEVVDGLAASLPSAVFYHKAGFSNDWYSDTVFISVPGSDRAWIVGLAGHPGRNILDGAARTIGSLIANGSLQGTDSPAVGGPAAVPVAQAPAPTPARELPERCTYRSYQWNTRTGRSDNHRDVDHPYSEVVDDERSPADPDCTVCSQDQVIIDPATLGITGVEPIAVCWKYADAIREALANIHASGEFEIVQLDGYRAGRTRGRTVDGLRTEWSNHSFGAAIDLNRDQNGLYRGCDVSSVTTRTLRGCTLGQGGEWDPDRNPRRTIEPGGIVYEEFTRRVGWRWGGELEGRMRDLMHFSLTGE